MANFIDFQQKAAGQQSNTGDTDFFNTADDDVNQSDFTGTDMYNTADDDVNQSDFIGTNFTGMRMYGPNPTETGLQTGTGDPEPTSRISDGIIDFTDAPTYKRFTPPKMIDITNDLITTKTVADVSGDFNFSDRNFILNKTNRSPSLFNTIKNRASEFAKDYIVGDYFKDPSRVDNIITKKPTSDDDKPNNQGTSIGSNFNLEEEKEKLTAGFSGESGFQEGGFVDPTVDVFNNPDRYGLQEGGQPQLVGGVMPQNIPESETVADDVPAKLKPNSFVVNGATTEEIILNPESINIAGVQDIRKMILDAYSFSREKGMQTGQVDRGLYEKSVDVALSKGELVIPPDLVNIIGKDRLTKINNRGKREVRRRAKAAQ